VVALVGVCSRRCSKTMYVRRDGRRRPTIACLEVVHCTMVEAVRPASSELGALEAQQTASPFRQAIGLRMSRVRAEVPRHRIAGVETFVILRSVGFQLMKTAEMPPCVRSGSVYAMESRIWMLMPADLCRGVSDSAQCW
jgi:hypothetical protein